MAATISFAFLLKQITSAQHESIALLVQFDDPAWELLADHDGQIRHMMDVDLARRHESLVSSHIHLESPLVGAGASGLDHLALFKMIPGGSHDAAWPGQHEHVVSAIPTFDQELGLATRLRRFLKLRERADSLHLGSELDIDLAPRT